MIVDHVRNMGIVPMALTLARQTALLAGSLTHCIDNWRVISQDQWILETIWGYRIPCLTQPPQDHSTIEVITDSHSEILFPQRCPSSLLHYRYTISVMLLNMHMHILRCCLSEDGRYKWRYPCGAGCIQDGVAPIKRLSIP